MSDAVEVLPAERPEWLTIDNETARHSMANYGGVGGDRKVKTWIAEAHAQRRRAEAAESATIRMDMARQQDAQVYWDETTALRAAVAAAEARYDTLCAKVSDLGALPPEAAGGPQAAPR